MWYFRCSAIQQSAVVFCICKVAPRSVLDVSSVIQCRIYIVFCNSAAARMLHCVLHLQAGPAWTFQVWFNVVFSVCVASQAPHTVLDVSRTQTHKKHKRHIHTHTHLSLWGRDLFYVTLWRAESVWPLSILLRQQQPSKKGWFEQMLDCVQCRTHVLNTHALSWSKLLDYSNLLFYWLVLPRPPRLMTF